MGLGQSSHLEPRHRDSALTANVTDDQTTNYTDKSVYGMPPTCDVLPRGETSWSLIAPPAGEMQELHRLAQLGNMRDIVRYSEHIAGLDSRYQPFAAHFCQLANGYQSKAIMAFIEEHLS